MKTSTVLRAAGIVTMIAGSAIIKSGVKGLKEHKLIARQYEEDMATRQQQAEIATELLDRVETVQYQKGELASADLNELLMDLHFFWNAARALDTIGHHLNQQVFKFEADNDELLERDRLHMNMPNIDAHLADAEICLRSFLERNGEQAL